MYSIYQIRDTVRVPPKEFSSNLKETILKVVRESYEGLLDEDMGVVVSVTSIDEVREGKIVPGDGAAYYDADLSLLVYRPEMHEVVDGVVSEATEFGVFVKIGPIEGLIHVSQIMDDYINYDPKLPGFIGKETNKKLQVTDTVLARIVSISLKGNISSSKIGLTMRQIGLGKKEWQKLDEKKSEKDKVKKKQQEGKKPKVKGERQ